MFDMKYSVVIPVYNAEKYIGRCVESILNQGYKDLEIIVVNDGSEDSTLNVLEKYKNKQLRVFTVKNGGVSRARNIGVDKARGEFVIFVDSDDYLVPDFFNTIEKINLESSYIYIFEYEAVYKNPSYMENELYSEIIELSKNDVVLFCANSNLSPYSNIRLNTVWSKIFDSQIAKTIKFDEKLNVGEDAIFFLEAVAKSEKVVYINQKMYCYYQNEESITHVCNGNMYENECRWQKKFSDVISEFGIREENEIIEYCLFKGLLNNLYLNILNDHELSPIQQIKKIHLLLERDLYKNKKIAKEIYMLFSKKDKVVIYLLEKKLYGIIPFLYQINRRLKR